MAGRQIQRGLDAALLDLAGVIASGLESPGLRGRPRAFVVTDLDKQELFSVLFRKLFQVGAALFPRSRDFLAAGISRLDEREIGEDADVIERVPELHVLV